MRSVRTLAALLVLSAAPAFANDYVSDNQADWYRYMNANPAALGEVTAKIQIKSGNWTYWDQFGGLGARWVYNDPNSDWLWIWNGQRAVLVGNLGRSQGWSFVGDLGGLNAGPMVATTGGSVTVPAGTFTNVTELKLTTRAADAGVTRIWFAKDIGIVKWEEQSIAGPVTMELATGNVAGQSLPGTTTPPVTPPTTTATVAPAQWEESETILWGCNDTYLVLDVYADSFTALDGHAPRVISDVSVATQYVASQLRYEMTNRNVPMNDVDIYVAAVDSIWMRDYGPFILRDPNGQLVVGDSDYYPGRPNDDNFPVVYSQFRGWPRVHSAISYEGGNYMSDGRGQLFASMGLLRHNPNMTRAQVENELFKLGGNRVALFEPLVQEGTTHIDMFAKITSPTTAVVSQYPTGHRQKAVTDAAAAQLQTMGYQVSRVMAHTGHDEYATYSNAVLANGIVLVPQYGNPALDQAALDTYNAQGFQARGVDCALLIQYGGAVHCISMQVPAR